MAGRADKEYLGSSAGKAGIAIDVDSVQEVFEVRAITRLPGCPAFVSGMINIRGNVIPVLDLMNVFDAAAAVKRVAVLKTSEGLVGLLIGGLDDLVRFERLEEVGAVPDALKGVGHALDAKGRAGEREYYLVDVERLIASTLPHKAQ
jgi:purine-binding chemotaxis protein CheW